MNDQRLERADAARNRDSILRATESLLATHAAEHVSLDRVASAAGVGKGTVFRRFGSRTGLFQELLAERARALRDAIESGPPPLGPGAPPVDRLLAFLDALAGLAVDNLTLIAAHDRACAEDTHSDPTYQRWHIHLTGLITVANPDLDSDFLAHVLLGCFDGQLVRHVTADGGVRRLRDSVRNLASAAMDQPEGAAS